MWLGDFLRSIIIIIIIKLLGTLHNTWALKIFSKSCSSHFIEENLPFCNQIIAYIGVLALNTWESFFELFQNL